MNQPAAAFSQRLAAVDSLDAAGKHADAINFLARATSGGDSAAMSLLGHRLLTGDRAPSLPAEAVRFLLDASRRGEIRALERVAALTAGGIFLRQDWPEALRLLSLAAAGGSESARTQLRVIAGQPGFSGDWTRLAASIDLKACLGSPPGEPLLADAPVHRFHNLMSAEGCAWLIAASQGRLQPARVYDTATGRDTVAATRSNSQASFGIADVGVLHLVLQARMSAACGQPLKHMEAPAVLHYALGEQITDHYDFVDPQSANYREHLRQQGQRVATFLLYLNEDYEGGETDFPRFALCHKGTRGMGLCFLNALPDGEPDLRMLHAGRPPRRGEKWIVSQFVRNRPVRP